MKQDIIVNRIDSFKKKYVNFKDKTDYHVFTLLCMKYFFFCEDNAKFDEDEVIDYLTDGANDGGIDAIFNDPNSEDNDVIIMQSKYYNKSRLKINDIIMELHKIKNTLNSFKEEKFASFNKNLVMAYKNSIITAIKEKARPQTNTQTNLNIAQYINANTFICLHKSTQTFNSSTQFVQ